MKCIIIYYSQTGNTEKIAKAIQSGVNLAAGNCDIIKMQDANPRKLREYDLIGIGTPVWGGEPENAKYFIKDMHFVGGKHVFSFCTHGTMPDKYFRSVLPKLSRQGLVVIGTADWYCDCTLPTASRPYHTSGHPDKIDLQAAERFGSEMVTRSRRISAGETDLIPPKTLPLKVKENAVSKFKSMLKFHKELCVYPECKLCMDNCPMYGIDLTRKPPVIARPCVNCEWCVRICPTGALDADEYHNYLDLQIRKMSPNGNTPPIILESLSKAEAEGRFRRLVPEECIDGNNLLFKVIKKHPMWIMGEGLNTK